MSDKVYTIEEIKKNLNDVLKDEPVYKVILFVKSIKCVFIFILNC